jgi:hypothetical protein
LSVVVVYQVQYEVALRNDDHCQTIPSGLGIDELVTTPLVGERGSQREAIAKVRGRGESVITCHLNAIKLAREAGG